MMRDFSEQWVNLASEKLGAVAVDCSDDFFAPMQRMLSDAAPVFIPDKYDDHGKWMDGWESRRKRTPGNDWCTVKLARPGIIHGVEIDTTHFTGNYAPAMALEACQCADDTPGSDQHWTEISPRADLQGDSQHQFEIEDKRVFSHVRLQIYPDGGIARLRVFAKPQVDWDNMPVDSIIDLAAALNGGVALACNDQHFGHMKNLLTPGRGVNMGDGWETARRRGPGNDWVVIALAHAGTISNIEIDTAHFKGNFPDRCDIRGAFIDGQSAESIIADSENWPLLMPETKLSADNIHQFNDNLEDLGPITHIRMHIYPDGGVSRLRLFGTIN